MTTTTERFNFLAKFPHFDPIRLVAVVSAVAVAGSLTAQYSWGMDPCPLCLLQRLIFFVLLALSSLMLLFPKEAFVRRAAFPLLLSAITMVGIAVFYYHLRLLTSESDGGCSLLVPQIIGAVQDLMPERFIYLLDGTGSCTPEKGSLEAFEALVLVVIAGAMHLLMDTFCILGAIYALDHRFSARSTVAYTKNF